MLLFHHTQYTNVMAIVVDMANRLEQVTKAQLPQYLIAKVTRKNPGMGESTIKTDSESDSLFSLVSSTMASIVQNAAAASPLSAWDKPVSEVEENLHDWIIYPPTD